MSNNILLTGGVLRENGFELVEDRYGVAIFKR